MDDVQYGTHGTVLDLHCATLLVCLFSEDGDVNIGRSLIVINTAFSELLSLNRDVSDKVGATMMRHIPSRPCAWVRINVGQSCSLRSSGTRQTLRRAVYNTDIPTICDE